MNVCKTARAAEFKRFRKIFIRFAGKTCDDVACEKSVAFCTPQHRNGSKNIVRAIASVHGGENRIASALNRKVKMRTHAIVFDDAAKALVDEFGIHTRYAECDAARFTESFFEEIGERIIRTVVFAAVLRDIDRRKNDFVLPLRFEGVDSGKHVAHRKRNRFSPSDSDRTVRAGVIAAVLYFKR